MELTKKQSDVLFVAKAFAILSVVCAHMSFTNEYFVAETIRNCLGQIGVAVFFIVSGFFYKRTEKDRRNFWRKKVKNALIPWFVISSAVFIVSIIIGGKVKALPIAFIKNFLGIGTHYWYMSITFILFGIFKHITKRWELIVCVVISVVSVYLTTFKILPCNGNFNQYMNPFNWIGFFALGIILRKENLLEKLISFSMFTISFIGLVVSIVFAVFKGSEIKAYIDMTSIFTEIFGFLFVINVSSVFAKSKLLIDIGKKSFFIYLMHIQVAGIINTRLPYNALFFVLRPFIALAVCYIVAVLFKYLLKLLKIEKYNFIFGLDR